MKPPSAATGTVSRPEAVTVASVALCLVGDDRRAVGAARLQEAERHRALGRGAGVDPGDPPLLPRAARDDGMRAGRAVEQPRVVPRHGQGAQEGVGGRVGRVGLGAIGEVLEAGLEGHGQRELVPGGRSRRGQRGRVVHRADGVAREHEVDVVRGRDRPALGVLGAEDGLHRQHVRPCALDAARERAAVEVDHQPPARRGARDRVVDGDPPRPVGLQEVGLDAGHPPPRPAVEQPGAAARVAQLAPVRPQQDAHAAVRGVADQLGRPRGIPALVDQHVLPAAGGGGVDVRALGLEPARARGVRPPRPRDAARADPAGVADPRRPRERERQARADHVAEAADDRELPRPAVGARDPQLAAACPQARRAVAGLRQQRPHAPGRDQRRVAVGAARAAHVGGLVGAFVVAHVALEPRA